MANIIQINGFGISSSNAGGGASDFPYTGSAIISGSLIITGSTTSTLGFTGSLFGTSSWAANALTASFIQTAQTASYITGSAFTNTNPALSASYALTASHALNGGGGVFNSTSSIVGDSTNTVFNINHGFNTRNLHITVYDSASGDIVYPDLKHVNANTSSVTFANAPKNTNPYIVYISQ